MDAIVAAVTAELIKLIPALVGAAGVAAIAWLKWLKDMATVRREFTASAVRQAMDQHGDNEQADAAAHAELHRIPAALRPKNVEAAVKAAVEVERAARVIPASEPEA